MWSATRGTSSQKHVYPVTGPDLHLTDIVLAHSPADPAALRVKCAALEQLLAASGRENFSEVQWLEQEIKSATSKEGK